MASQIRWVHALPFRPLGCVPGHGMLPCEGHPPEPAQKASWFFLQEPEQEKEDSSAPWVLLQCEQSLTQLKRIDFSMLLTDTCLPVWPEFGLAH